MDNKECPDCEVIPDDKGRCPCNPFTVEDVWFVRAMKGSTFAKDSIVSLPSGTTITGDGMMFLLDVYKAHDQ